MAEEKFIVEPHFRLQEWVAEEKGYFQGRRSRLRFPRADPVDRWQASLQRRQGRRDAKLRARPRSKCELRLSLDGRRCGIEGQGPALCRRLFGVALRPSSCRPTRPSRGPRILPACRSRSATSPAATTRRSRRSSNIMPADKINLSFADGMLFKRMELLLDGKAPATSLFSGPYYFAEQLGYRKIIDTTFMIATMITERSRSGGPAQVLPRPAPRATRHRCSTRSATRTTTSTNSRCAIMP